MAAPVLAGPRGDAIRADSPFGRVGTPEEVAAVVDFLSQPDARWVSGTVVDCNGASYIH
jgi:3-oxoacyl-[acyl-carrier protein] reductase